MIDTASPVGSYAPDFELPDVDGSVHHLTRYLEAQKIVVVVIMCNHCPEVEDGLAELKALQDEFASQHVVVIGINANDEKQVPEDSFEQMRTFATTHHLNFPYLRDITQDVARTFGAETTPQAFLLDRTGKIQYTGAIHDASQPPTQYYLREAIAQLLAGEPISIPTTDPTGCSIKWRTV